MSITQVQQQKKQNGILSSLGTLAAIGGAVTGQPWLSALGTGMKGADSLMNGGGSSGGSNSGQSQVGESLKYFKELLDSKGESLTDNNLAKSGQQNAQDKAQKILGQDYSPSWENYKPAYSNSFVAPKQQSGWDVLGKALVGAGLGNFGLGSLYPVLSPYEYPNVMY